MNPLLGRAAGRWFRASRPRRGRAGFAAGAAGAERLEGRVLLTAGDWRWSAPADIRAADDDRFADVAVQADGKIVAVGTAYRAPDDDFLIARYTADGRLDQSFGTGGVRYFNFGSRLQDRAGGVVIQGDGKIVVAGTVVDTAGKFSLGLIRLDRDGDIDTTYGNSGQVVQGWPSGNLSFGGDGLALTADGGVVVATTKTGGNPAVASVYKFTSAGVRDEGFNYVNFYTYGFRDLPTSNSNLRDLAVAPSGDIVAVDSGGFVTRLTSVGALDGGFGGGDGVAQVTFDGSATSATSIALMTDGRIVVGGYAGNALPGVVRLKGDGTYDNTFGGDGRASFDPTSSVDVIRDIAVLPNGAVVAVGQDGAIAVPDGDGWITLLTPGGVRDTAFSGDGTAFWYGGGGDVSYAVAVTAGGHYAVGGYTFFQGGDTANALHLFEGRFGRRDDLLGWAASGDWYAAESTGTAFGNSYFGTWNRNAGWKVVETADLDRDGDTDMLGRDSTGQWWIGRNTGSGFATAAGAKWNEEAGWKDLQLADFNGDGRADVAARTSTGQWWVSLSTGTGLANGQLWATWNENAGWRDVLAADFNGDGRSDLAGRTGGGQWYVGLGGGAGFSLALWDTWSTTGGWRDVAAGDFDGDGRQDIAGRTSGGQWWVSRSTGSGFTKSHYGTWNEGANWVDVGVGDFDRDGRMDVAGRASDGQWYVGFAQGSGTFVTAAWGKWNPGAGWRDARIGDFDGDGRADFAGRTSTGELYVTRWVNGPLVTARWGKWNEVEGWTAFGGELVATG